MRRPPHAVVSGKRVLWRWTELVHPANDLLRCLALSCAANDNPLYGRPFGPGAA